MKRVRKMPLDLATRTGPEARSLDTLGRPGGTDHQSRRRFLARTFAAVGALALGGCERLSRSEWFPKVLGAGEAASSAVARAVTSRRSMAQEFTEADRSPMFRSNGTAEPNNAEYASLASNGFADYALDVGGLVATQWRLHLARERSPPVDPFIHQGEVGGIDRAFDVRPGDRPGRGEHRLHRAHATSSADRSRSTGAVQVGTGRVAGDEPSEALRSRAQHKVELVGKRHPPTAAPGAFAGHHRADGEHESGP